MPSIESAVITYLKGKVSELSGSPQESKHFYDFSKNDGVNNDFIFAVRSGPGRPVSGTIGRATYQQSFEVEIAKDFIETTETDEAIRGAIESIREKFDALSSVLVGRGQSNNIIQITAPDFDAPVINHEQKSVSITYTFPITYYVSTRGVA